MANRQRNLSALFRFDDAIFVVFAQGEGLI
jgi:hypothetical protein